MIGGKKKCIGLIFGGESNEHEVSISSAKTVFQAFNSEINKQRFTVKAFYIKKYGDWLDIHLSEKILIGEIEFDITKKQEILNQEKINFLQPSFFHIFRKLIRPNCCRCVWPWRVCCCIHLIKANF